MLQAGRKGTTSSTRPRVRVLAGRERGHRMPKRFNTCAWHSKLAVLHCVVNKFGKKCKLNKPLEKPCWTGYFPYEPHTQNHQRIKKKLNREVVLCSHCGGYETIFIIKCNSREANMYFISSTASMRWLCSLTSFSGCPASIRLGLSSLSGCTRAATATLSSNQWLT